MEESGGSLILKQGKPPDKMESFRPISLLNCTGKRCERLIYRRLIYLLQESGALSPAGFRIKHVTEDRTP